MASTICIRELRRTTSKGEVERLQFEEGVNVLVGPPDTGKTTWLRMLNYLLGDKDRPEESFDSDLVDKYDSISATVEIGEEAHELERRWEYGYRSKVLLDGEKIHQDVFSDVILEHLGWPRVSFPLGNPYRKSNWVRLSFRILLRHIYRTEGSWTVGSLAPKQRESHLHAALAYFLGIADRMYPPEWHDLVEKEEELRSVEARRDEFTNVVEEVSEDLFPTDASVSFVTPEILEKRLSDLRSRDEELKRERIKNVQGAAEEGTSNGYDLELSERRASLVQRRESLVEERDKTKERMSEVKDLVHSLRDELQRMEQTQTASDVLSNLSVTNCPVCDQEVDESAPSGTCYLCGQDVDVPEAEDGDERLQFERQQIEEELQEFEDMMDELERQFNVQKRKIAGLDEEINEIDTALEPAKSDISGLVDSKLAEIDSERGRIKEKIQQIQRFSEVVTKRDHLEERMTNLQAEVEELEETAKGKRGNIDFGSVTRDLEKGMKRYISEVNGYVNKYNISSEYEFPNIDFRVEMSRRNFQITVNGEKWHSQMGGVRRTQFLLAYTYGLISLTEKEKYRYPGISIIDFLPDLIDREDIGGRENYLVEPFSDLCESSDERLQVIIAGAAFEGLPGATVQELEQVWTR